MKENGHSLSCCDLAINKYKQALAKKLKQMKDNVRDSSDKNVIDCVMIELGLENKE